MVRKIFAIGIIWQILVNVIYGETDQNLKRLKRDCINATIRAIELEIERHQKWLKIPKENLTPGAEPREKIAERLKRLKKDLLKYKNMKIEDYKLPPKKEVIGWVHHPCKEGTLLRIKNMTRSGPFYHIVGIKGGNYDVIKPRVKYKMTIYLLYPRHYPFFNYYIFIENYEKISN
ncbi:MAG: hypothetical protein DRP67_04015 [Candidatus Omnitrophota bacterium]|nr:MAG: hypothetical protein DRP67_04015 [Candidatus Omnitrophota bacterium]